MTPGDRDAYPTSDTFSIGDDFTFSPDSQFLVFTALPERDEAWSTNYDICRVPVTGGKAECLTKDNPAADGAPRFSPDGKWLAYRAQKRAGFEADRWQIMVVNDAGWQGQAAQHHGRLRRLARCLRLECRQPENLSSPPTTRATTPIFAVDVPWAARSHSLYGVRRCNVGSVVDFSARSARTLVFTCGGLDHPAEVCAQGFSSVIGRRRSLTTCSQANTKLLAELDLPRPESVTVKGAGGTPMQMWILKPPGFDPKKKWPLAYLVHGGPQGAWEDGWSYRWNPELWAAQGYVVALPNPRGSTGFGQKYVDEISGDWGGKCYDDLMAGVAYLEKQPYIDTERMAAAGASFGGYMMNWFAGQHRPSSRR